MYIGVIAMAINERGAGRKKALDDKKVEEYRKRFRDGERIFVLAKEAGVSRQTMSAYLHEDRLNGEIFYQYSLWAKLNREFRNQDLHRYSLRIDYMDNNKCSSVILVDFYNEKIEVINKTQDPILRAFGMNAKPSWEDFIYFLKERCIPESRFQIRQILKDLELSQYDLIQILEKTEGRTGEDEMWLKFAYLQEGNN